MSNFRNMLNTVAARRRKQPQYNDIQAGPLHAAQWTSTVSWDGMEYGRGIGRTKDESREAAARAALELLAPPGGWNL